MGAVVRLWCGVLMLRYDGWGKLKLGFCRCVIGWVGMSRGYKLGRVYDGVELICGRFM